jgi:hypothetical protein
MVEAAAERRVFYQELRSSATARIEHFSTAFRPDRDDLMAHDSYGSGRLVLSRTIAA